MIDVGQHESQRRRHPGGDQGQDCLQRTGRDNKNLFKLRRS